LAGYATPRAGDRPDGDGEAQPRIRYRLPDGRYMTEEDIEQHQYRPPTVIPKVRGRAGREAEGHTHTHTHLHVLT
jgi:hypothetical protein